MDHPVCFHSLSLIVCGLSEPSHQFGCHNSSRSLQELSTYTPREWVEPRPSRPAVMARKTIREYDSKRLLKAHILRLQGLKLPLNVAQVPNGLPERIQL